MKILIFDNSSAKRIDNKNHTVNKNTGLFGKELKNLGNDVEYFSIYLKDNKSINPYLLEKNGLKFYGCRKSKIKFITYLKAYLFGFIRILANDFTYFFYPTSYRYLIPLCIIFKKKYGLYVRGDENINNTYSNFIYKHALTIFTVSNIFTDNINLFHNKKIANTIKPMISFSDKDIIRDRVYKKENNFNILFLARLELEKGIIELLNAISILKEKSIFNFKLNIVGNGNDFQLFVEKCEELNLSNIVFFKGEYNDEKMIKEAYLNSDIYILPTYYPEGFPRTLYEAMIFGTPIITTFVAGIPALMKDEYNCKEIKPKSVECIVEVLEFAFNNYSKMGEFAKNAIITVEKVVDSKRPTHAHHLHQIISKLC